MHSLFELNEAVGLVEHATKRVSLKHFDFESPVQTSRVVDERSPDTATVKLRVYEKPTHFIAEQSDEPTTRPAASQTHVCATGR